MVCGGFANPPLRLLPGQHEASRRNGRNGFASLRYPFPRFLAVQHIDRFAREVQPFGHHRNYVSEQGLM
jgi:hypothetical protein